MFLWVRVIYEYTEEDKTKKKQEKTLTSVAPELVPVYTTVAAHHADHLYILYVHIFLRVSNVSFEANLK